MTETGRAALEALAIELERAASPDKALDRKIALAVGWVRQSPGQVGRRHPAWFHPDDCRNGSPVMDSLHGTEVWRDPLAYSSLIDAARTLAPDNCAVDLTIWRKGDDEQCRARVLPIYRYGDRWFHKGSAPHYVSDAATPALALCAAALRARAALIRQEEGK